MGEFAGLRNGTTSAPKNTLSLMGCQGGIAFPNFLFFPANSNDFHLNYCTLKENAKNRTSGRSRYKSDIAKAALYVCDESRKANWVSRELLRHGGQIKLFHFEKEPFLTKESEYFEILFKSRP